jgi:ABC-2 type transport system permease protein
VSAFRLVVEREVREATRRRSFWVIAGLLLIASAAAMILPEVLDTSDSAYRVAVVGDEPELEQLLVQGADSFDGEVDITTVDDEAAAQQAVEDDEVDVGVAAGDPSTVYVTAGEQQQLVGIVQQALAVAAVEANFRAAGLDADEAAEVLAVPSADVQELDQAGADRRGAAAILSVLLYLLLFGLMMQVANGVAIEKSNRISEVLLAIVRPGPLLFGKVAGVGSIGAITLAVGLTPVLVKLALGGDLPDGLAGGLAACAAWFLLGIALYLVVAGALASLVERPEEAGTVVSPLMAVVIGSYLVALSAPDSPVAVVLAWFPFSSPLVMPSRVVAGESSAVEMVGSLVVLLVAVVVVGRASAVVYRRAIVRTGRRLKLRDVLRAPRPTAG